MEIVELGKIDFKLLQIGDCFISNGKLFMKISSCMLCDEEMNAIDLSKGTVAQFFDDTEVMFKNARIIYGGVNI